MTWAAIIGSDFWGVPNLILQDLFVFEIKTAYIIIKYYKNHRSLKIKTIKLSK